VVEMHLVDPWVKIPLFHLGVQPFFLMDLVYLGSLDLSSFFSFLIVANV
jgi:hypothetical protein